MTETHVCEGTDPEPLPLEASPMGQVAEELRPHLKAVYTALDELGDWVASPRCDGEGLKDLSTELVARTLVLDTELRRRVG